VVGTPPARGPKSHGRDVEARMAGSFLRLPGWTPLPNLSRRGADSLVLAAGVAAGILIAWTAVSSRYLLPSDGWDGHLVPRGDGGGRIQTTDYAPMDYPWILPRQAKGIPRTAR